jgi:hypothetical protein
MKCTVEKRVNIMTPRGKSNIMRVLCAVRVMSIKQELLIGLGECEVHFLGIMYQLSNVL